MKQPQTVPLKIASRVMAMATILTAAMTSSLTALALDDRDGLWEVACSPHSWLSEAAEQHGLQPKRINLHSGFDLYKDQTWAELHRLRALRRPRRIWFSLPCTKWCPWTSLNFSTPERKVVLESQRRKERRLLRNAAYFILATLEDDPETQFYWEWPTQCFGWDQKPLQELAKSLQEMEVPWLSCRIDGCNYGLRNEQGEFLRKRWTVMTCDEKFHQEFRSKVCPCHHRHGRIEGKETAKTSYYPWKLVQSFAGALLLRLCLHDIYG